jgi:hypothetical protein
MQELVELLGQFASQFDAVSVDYRDVDNLHKLILDELPYGQIDPNNLVQGSIEVDGPAQDPPNGGKPLQWHFGGAPYEVCKAIRIQYGYSRYLDGVEINATGSLFIGYELDQSYYSSLPKASAQRVQALDAQSKAAAREARADANDVSKKETSDAAQREFESARHALARFHEARNVFNTPAAPPNNPHAMVAALRAALGRSPGQVTKLAKYVDAANFDPFVQQNWPFHPSGSYTTGSHGALSVSAAATELSRRLGGAGERHGLPQVRIEFDGPARDYNSKNPFPYTAETLFNDPSGIYQKLLWWYFGARAYRITKAMRMEYRDTEFPGHILIGYQGPSFP